MINPLLRFPYPLAFAAMIMAWTGCVGVEPDRTEDPRGRLEVSSEPSDLPLEGRFEESTAIEDDRHFRSVEAALPKLDYPENGIFLSRDPFNIELRETSLDHALQFIGEMGKENLLFKGDFSDPVEISFPEVRLDDALRTLLVSYDCILEEKEGLYVVKRLDPADPISHVFQLRSITAPGLQSNLEALMGPGGSLLASPEGDRIMVTAPKETLERVARYLDSVDRPEKQVLIEARLIEVVLTDLLELGAEINFRNIHLDDTTSQFLSSFLPDSQNGRILFTGDKAAIDGSIRMLKELTRVEILSRPKVLAKNGKEAKIEIIQEVPYVDSTATTTGTSDGVGTSSVEQVEFKEVGIKLMVTPLIKGDHSMELKILQDASEQTGTFLSVPVVDRRVIDTTLVVENNETVVIGGLINEKTLEEVSGIPLLMDIPLLGYLFRRTRDRVEKRELLILISPQVVNSSAEIGYTEPSLEKGS